MYKFSTLMFFLVAAIIPVFGDFEYQKFAQVGAKCKEDTKTSDEEVQKILNKQVPETPEGKCMMACIFKEMGILTADGKFDAEANLKAAEENFKDDEAKKQQAKEFADYCKDRVNAVQDDEKGCERAAAMHQCGLEKMKQMGMK